MVDFERARTQMVESQIRAGGVTNDAILARLRAVPREDFVDPDRRELAYADDTQWLGGRATGRFLAPPAVLAKLLKLAEIAPGDTVLDIGVGTGYSTAVIAGLAGSVVGLELDAGLAAIARDKLGALGLANASIVAGDIDRLPPYGFDVIIVQGTLASVPDALVAALNPGGRLIALMAKAAVPVATVFVNAAAGLTARSHFNAFLPPLPAQRKLEEFVF